MQSSDVNLFSPMPCTYPEGSLNTRIINMSEKHECGILVGCRPFLFHTSLDQPEIRGQRINRCKRKIRTRSQFLLCRYHPPRTCPNMFGHRSSQKLLMVFITCKPQVFRFAIPVETIGRSSEPERDIAFICFEQLYKCGAGI